jgi:hypothetical protein
MRAATITATSLALCALFGPGLPLPNKVATPHGGFVAKLFGRKKDAAA